MSTGLIVLFVILGIAGLVGLIIALISEKINAIICAILGLCNIAVYLLLAPSFINTEGVAVSDDVVSGTILFAILSGAWAFLRFMPTLKEDNAETYLIYGTLVEVSDSLGTRIIGLVLVSFGMGIICGVISFIILDNNVPKVMVVIPVLQVVYSVVCFIKAVRD